jgi:hypothetical protein
MESSVGRKNMPLFKGLASLSLLAFAGLATGCGPGYLTPDLVREHLENPKGMVDKNTVGRVAPDFFGAKEASLAEQGAFFTKSSQSGEGSGSNIAMGIVQNGTFSEALATGVIEDVGDVFCAASLIAAIASFDDCDRGENCEAELEIDSCVLRIGDEGDERARGKLKFFIKNTTSGEFDRGELRIEFEDWETTRNEEMLNHLEGILAIETTEYNSEEREEVIMSSDLLSQILRIERGFFDDGVEWASRLTAALRFSEITEGSTTTGKLEVLAFVDETDDTRDESVAIVFESQSHQLSDTASLTEATLEVVGSNGSFSCVFNEAEEERADGVTVYTSSGDCVDEDGETFSFSAREEHENA